MNLMDKDDNSEWVDLEYAEENKDIGRENNPAFNAHNISNISIIDYAQELMGNPGNKTSRNKTKSLFMNDNDFDEHINPFRAASTIVGENIEDSMIINKNRKAEVLTLSGK